MPQSARKVADYPDVKANFPVEAGIVGLGLNKATRQTVPYDVDLSGYATMSDVNAAIAAQVAALVDSSPSTLDTLNELANALGDDANFATTVTNQIATKITQTQGDERYSQLGHTHSSISNSGGSVSVNSSGIIRFISTSTADATINAFGNLVMYGAFSGLNTFGEIYLGNNRYLRGTVGAGTGSLPLIGLNTNDQLVLDATGALGVLFGGNIQVGGTLPASTQPPAQVAIINGRSGFPAILVEGGNIKVAHLGSTTNTDDQAAIFINPSSAVAANYQPIRYKRQSDGSIRFVVDVDGNLGLGGTPLRPLHAYANASGYAARFGGDDNIDVIVGGAQSALRSSGTRKFILGANGADNFFIDTNGVPTFDAAAAPRLPLKIIVNTSGVGFRVGDSDDINYLEFVSGGVLSRFQTTGNRPLQFQVNNIVGFEISGAGAPSLFLNGVLKTVEVGAADSAGVGYRELRVLN